MLRKNGPEISYLIVFYRIICTSASFFLILSVISCGQDKKVSDLNYPSRNPNWQMVVDTNYPACVPQNSAAVIRTTKGGIQYVRTPDYRFNNLPGYPFKPNYVLIDGLRMHYVDEGPKNGEVILMLHGQPSWSYLYRKMVPVLAKAGYRAIALDLIGTGRSDKPIELGIHTFEQQVKWVKKFIREQKLKQITLFCQDWGGLIGLRIAGDRPGDFARIVAANTTLPVMKKGENPLYVPNPVKIDCSVPDNFILAIGLASLEKFPQSFQRWINYCLSAPNMEPGQVLEAATVIDLTPAEKAAYNAPYPDIIYKASPRAFPSMMAAIEDNNQQAWENLGKFEKPFLTFAGEKDKLLGTKERINLLINHIPGAKGQSHERFNANHFIQEDVGEILAEKTVQFIKNNPVRK